MADMNHHETCGICRRVVCEHTAAIGAGASRSSPPEAARAALEKLAQEWEARKPDCFEEEAEIAYGSCAEDLRAALRSLPAEDPRTDEDFTKALTRYRSALNRDDSTEAAAARIALESAYARAREEGRRAMAGEAARCCGRLMLEPFPGPRQALAEAARRIGALASSPSPAPRADDGGREALRTAEAALVRAREALNHDRTGLAAALCRIREELRGRYWMRHEKDGGEAGSWGSYPYTEHTVETLRREISWAFGAIGTWAEKALNASGNLAGVEIRAMEEPLGVIRSALYAPSSGSDPGDEARGQAQAEACAKVSKADCFAHSCSECPADLTPASSGSDQGAPAANAARREES